MARPTDEDRTALRLLLAREDLTLREGEFVDSLSRWTGAWRAKQLAWFDALCQRYLTEGGQHVRDREDAEGEDGDD